MSKINIGRAVQNILPRTNSYTPLVEVIVNAIESIEEISRENNGKVEILVLRSDHAKIEGGLHTVEGFEIRDNGIGFSNDHRESFDTLYTDQKIEKGGRGFGRFVCLKHFDDFQIESVYESDEGRLMSRTFSVGRRHEIIEDEKVGSARSTDTGTTVRLFGLRRRTYFDLRLSTIAKVLVQRLLPFLVEEEFACPEIALSEEDGSETIILNRYLRFIEEIDQGRCSFELPSISPQEEFYVRTFKIYEPRNLTSQISLVAHRREVSETPLKRYIPEFEDAFYEDNDRERKYVVRAYVFGDYLDRHVSVERGGFRFGTDPESHAPIGKKDIESNVAEIARDAIGSDFLDRRIKKREHVQKHVDTEAPWLKSVLGQSDLAELRWNASPDEIEGFLHAEKLAQEHDIRKGIDKIMFGGRLDAVEADITEIVRRASEKNKDDLVRYIAFRRSILELFEKSFERGEHEKYLTEEVVHNIIFPWGRDSESSSFDDHNLWIIDERQNFSNHLSSDKPLGGGSLGQSDLSVYDNRVLFRGEEAEANPITIFALKCPGDENFVRNDHHDNPVEQMIRYARDIRNGKCKTPNGRPIQVTQNTPAHGYIICDPTRDFENWLLESRSFTPTPDGLGWFQWISDNKLYIEVLSWEKVLRDAEMRNRVFFKRLGSG